MAQPFIIRSSLSVALVTAAQFLLPGLLIALTLVAIIKFFGIHGRLVPGGAGRDCVAADCTDPASQQHLHAGGAVRTDATRDQCLCALVCPGHHADGDWLPLGPVQALSPQGDPSLGGHQSVRRSSDLAGVADAAAPHCTVHCQPAQRGDRRRQPVEHLAGRTN